jgi:hypothetical protein
MRSIKVDGNLQEIPLNTYDAIIIQQPNHIAFNLSRYALTNKKHVFIEAPLFSISADQLHELQHIAIINKVLLHVAYVYKWLPEFLQLQELSQSNAFGTLRHCRLAFTAPEDNTDALLLGAHLMHILYLLFADNVMQYNFNIVNKSKFGRQIIWADFNARCSVELEVNLLDTSKNIKCDIFGTNLTQHLFCPINDLIHAGLLELEYQHFVRNFQQLQNLPFNLDHWICSELQRLAQEDVLLA